MGCLLLQSSAAAETYLWYDDAGNPRMTDHFYSIPEERRASARVVDLAELERKAAAERAWRASPGPDARSVRRDPPAAEPRPQARDEANSEPQSFRLPQLGRNALGALFLGAFVLIVAIYGVRTGKWGDTSESNSEIIGTLAGIALLVACVWGFGRFGASRIWTHVDDRACQADGYWYATTRDGEPWCEKWYVIPGGRFRR